jgi:prolyl oligopeptidase
VVAEPDGKLLAYALSDGGTDWNIWHFRRVATAAICPCPQVQQVLAVSWARDSSGVYYSRYPLKAGRRRDAERGDDAGRPDVYFHKLDERSRPTAGLQVTDHPTRVPSGRSPKTAAISSSAVRRLRTNACWCRTCASRREAAAAVRRMGCALHFIGSKGDELYFQTTNARPRGRVIAVDARSPTRRLAHRGAAGDYPIDNAHYIGGACRRVHARRAQRRAALRDQRRAAGEVELPGLGTATGFQGTATTRGVLLVLGLPLADAHPAARRGDELGQRVPPAQRTGGLPPFVTEQVFFKSKDGTRVPMFIIRRKDAPRDGNQPVMLYGYGGFSVTLSPSFSPAIQSWLELGGNLRRSPTCAAAVEYGEDWHQAGTKAAQAERVRRLSSPRPSTWYARSTPSPKRLAILGPQQRLACLIGAALTQRPELFGAALPGVGVMDMLRYQTASANARQWSSDYGLAENAEEFPALRAYSPVHNVRNGLCYPPTLVTTADHDDRVVPWHSYKFAAELQHAQDCDNPVMIRVETRAGHGAGKPVWMLIEDIADQFGFVANALGMPAPAS